MWRANTVRTSWSVRTGSGNGRNNLQGPQTTDHLPAATLSGDSNRAKSPPLFISVILSFLNEENVLRELIRRLRAVMAGEKKRGTVGDYELIFVNDASTDNSLNILFDEAKLNDLVIVNMSRNFGVLECIMAGMTYVHGKAEAIVFMDADLQNPPEVIPQLVDRFLAHADTEVVYTTRTQREGESFLKLLLTKYGYRLINNTIFLETKGRPNYIVKNTVFPANRADSAHLPMY